MFINLENASDKVPREIFGRYFESKGISVVYISTMMDMYDEIKIPVKIVECDSKHFSVEIGLH